MAEKIPLNPDVLKWARHTAGMQLDDVAHKMGKNSETIALWEQGEITPTYVQLEKLAYQVYKRPLALFFFPEPPEEETLQQAFRTLPESEIEIMSPRMHLLLKKARAMQINVAELNDYFNPAMRNIVQDLKFSPKTPLKEMVSKVRTYLGIDLPTQFSWKDTNDALKIWRNTLEEHGVYVFKDAFEEDAFSGFCIHHEDFPIIYINNSTAKTRQIFSIFHELAHLLLGTSGVDAKDTEYIQSLKGDDKKIEIICNRFAGAFLVPETDFSKRIANIEINDLLVENLSNKYKVSREAILRKLLDRNLVSQQHYTQKVEKWKKEVKRKSSGGNYYSTKGTYLGEGYYTLAFQKYYQKKISVNQLADYLDVKVKSISGMESLLFKGEIT